MKRFLKAFCILISAIGLTSCSFDFSNFKIGQNTTHTSTDSNSDTSENNSDTSENTNENTSTEDSEDLRLEISGPKIVYVGQSVEYSVVFLPENTSFLDIVWNSTDNQKLEIYSGGTAVGRAIGNVSITASLKGPQNITFTSSFDVEIKIAKIQSFSLNKTSLELYPESSFTLKANYSPAYAIQTYEWFSSNTEIVEVEKDTGLVTAKKKGNAIVFVKTEDDVKAECQVTVSEIIKTTVFIYMCGADLESTYDRRNGYANSNYQGLASMDIDEILSVSGQPENVNIILETGGAKNWAKSEIDSSKNQRWEIKNGNLIKKDSFAKRNMGLSSTLQSFLEWGFQNYSANNYGLVFWNHGGALTGICFDENFNDDSLTHDEVATAVSTARNNKNISNKLDWVVYDACLMAVQDVIEYNSQNFDYMLASQESENGYGYDYDAWLPSLYANPAIDSSTLLEKIGHTFMLEEKEIYKTYNEPFDQTQSAFNLSKVQSYKESFESFASKLNSYLNGKTTKIQTLKGIIENSKKYGETEVSNNEYAFPFDIFDVEDTLENIIKNSNFSFLSSDVQTILEKLDELVIYEEHGDATSGCGICLFCPVSLYQYNYSNHGYSEGAKTNFLEWSNVTEKIFQSIYS